MKRKTILLILCIFLLTAYCGLPAAAAGTAHTFKIYQYNATTGATYYGVSGVTTTSGKDLAVSGVSNMAVTTGPDKIKGDIWTVDISQYNGMYSFKLKDVDTYQISSVYYNLSGLTDFSSGTTHAVYVKVADENTAAAFASVDFIPVYTALAINSGNSPFETRIQLPQGNYLRAYFLPSGATPYGLAEVEMKAGYDDQVRSQFAPAIIKSLIYTLNASSGTSTTATDDSAVALPKGTRYAEMHIAGASGNSVFYTKDGSAITKASSLTLEEGDYRELNQVELKNLNMNALGAISVRIDCYAAKP